jgi:hypothetical protein
MAIQNSLVFEAERSLLLRSLTSTYMEERHMKKLAYVIAAITAIAVAAPSVANAEKIVIKRGGHHDMHRGWHHRDMHRGWHHHDRVVIKHRY